MTVVSDHRSMHRVSAPSDELALEQAFPSLARTRTALIGEAIEPQNSRRAKRRLILSAFPLFTDTQKGDHQKPAYRETGCAGEAEAGTPTFTMNLVPISTSAPANSLDSGHSCWDGN